MKVENKNILNPELSDSEKKFLDLLAKIFVSSVIMEYNIENKKDK